MADSRTYNARVTTEALEKKYRDTFPSQAGAELVDDLYASGVIFPVVDFTAAAEGSALRADLQTAWDFSTGNASVNNAVSNIITNTGFWKIDLTCITRDLAEATPTLIAAVSINDGVDTKRLWALTSAASGADTFTGLTDDSFIVFVRAGDTVTLYSSGTATTLHAWYRQVADVSGNLVNPLGFTSS